MALSDKALTTVAAVETELGITGGSEPRLEGWIEDVSVSIAEFLSRVLERDGAISEKQPGEGSQEMALDRPPLNSVTSVTFLTAVLAATSYEIHDADAGLLYFIGLPSKWSAYIGEGVARAPVPGTERKSYTVVYDGGWITPGQNARAASPYFGVAVTLPRAISRAAIQAVVDVRARAGSSSDLASESLMSYSYSTRATAGAEGSYGLSDVVRALLSPYKFQEP